MTGESDLNMIKVLGLGGIIDFLLDFDVDRDETFPEQPEPDGLAFQNNGPGMGY